MYSTCLWLKDLKSVGHLFESFCNSPSVHERMLWGK